MQWNVRKRYREMQGEADVNVLGAVAGQFGVLGTESRE
jgi:hypothetical protein